MSVRLEPPPRRVGRAEKGDLFTQYSQCLLIGCCCLVLYLLFIEQPRGNANLTFFLACPKCRYTPYIMH